MRFPNIIFDLDGTLVDSIDGICFSLNHALSISNLNMRISISELSPLMGEPILKILLKLIPEITEEQAAGILVSFREHYNRIGWKKSQLYPQVYEQLTLLKRKGVLLFIATNKPSAITVTLLAHFGIRNMFEAVLCPDIHDEKLISKSQMLYLIVDRFSLNKSQTLMVGDAITDCHAARDCGIIFAYASYGYGDLSDHANFENSYKIEHLGELQKIIED
ncbi:MAG TPA: HAD family hydrolase [Desulfosporosinus sp.]|nr:HAD family hydrolase [Desulfosporosinus sp.]